MVRGQSPHRLTHVNTMTQPSTQAIATGRSEGLPRVTLQQHVTFDFRLIEQRKGTGLIAPPVNGSQDAFKLFRVDVDLLGSILSYERVSNTQVEQLASCR